MSENNITEYQENSKTFQFDFTTQYGIIIPIEIINAKTNKSKIVNAQIDTAFNQYISLPEKIANDLNLIKFPLIKEYENKINRNILIGSGKSTYADYYFLDISFLDKRLSRFATVFPITNILIGLSFLCEIECDILISNRTITFTLNKE